MFEAIETINKKGIGILITEQNVQDVLKMADRAYVMQQGLYENLTLEQIATACHISTSYLKVLFARYAGISPKAYYLKMRYNEALNLLKKGLSATEVATKMNFSSPSYFSAFMKRYAGLPPAKYVKTL